MLFVCLFVFVNVETQAIADTRVPASSCAMRYTTGCTSAIASRATSSTRTATAVKVRDPQ